MVQKTDQRQHGDHISAQRNQTFDALWHVRGLIVCGVRPTSRTLNTLIPNVSRVPREKSRISILLEPANLVLASTLSSRFSFQPDPLPSPYSNEISASVVRLGNRNRPSKRRVNVSEFLRFNLGTYSSTPTDLPNCWLDIPSLRMHDYGSARQSADRS